MADEDRGWRRHVARWQRSLRKPWRHKLASVEHGLRRLIGPAQVHWRWRLKDRQTPRPHGLPGELVVSLTSFPGRFGLLHLTLMSLLCQTVRPDRVVLWVDEKHADRVPSRVRALEAQGLSIRTWPEDIKCYMKIVPTLHQWPDATVVTADDDIHYWPTWLAELLETAATSPGSVVCHRAHRMTFSQDGRLNPYKEWRWGIGSPHRGADLFFTGVGGVLYPRGSLCRCLEDEGRYLGITPYNDDIWLNWMTRLQGFDVVTTGRGRDLVAWLGGQRSGLYRHNVRGNGNDEALRRMAEAYGDAVFRPAAGVTTYQADSRARMASITAL
jgi:hypothetical protein